MAKPNPGEKPTLMMLGGRGGSGKSWFKIDPEKNPGGGIYDPNKFVILDADSIKEQLKPPYEGWNAFQVHEESSDILEQAIEICVTLGLNVVLDMTMKTPKSAIDRISKFKEKQYQTEAHYMHLPPHEAAKRAIGRYKDGEGKPGEYKGRFVPVDTILAMAQNEESFDMVKYMVDDWSFRDNNVKRGEPPILISQKNRKNN
jgi:predicted ABC-type ATPase